MWQAGLPGGDYNPGNQIATFTISNIVTTAGATMGGFAGRPGGNDGPVRLQLP